MGGRSGPETRFRLRERYILGRMRAMAVFGGVPILRRRMAFRTGRVSSDSNRQISLCTGFFWKIFEKNPKVWSDIFPCDSACCQCVVFLIYYGTWPTGLITGTEGLRVPHIMLYDSAGATKRDLRHRDKGYFHCFSAFGSEVKMIVR